jgi:hypothetical protein
MIRILIMKWLWMFCMLIAIPLHAEIYVCKDDLNRTVYQDEPCERSTMRILQKAPEPSVADQMAAKERLEKYHERSQQLAAQTQAENLERQRQALEEERLALEKQRIELLERQSAAEQNRYPVYVRPMYPPRYGRHEQRHRNRDFGNQYRLRSRSPAP